MLSGSSLRTRLDCASLGADTRSVAGVCATRACSVPVLQASREDVLRYVLGGRLPLLFYYDAL